MSKKQLNVTFTTGSWGDGRPTRTIPLSSASYVSELFSVGRVEDFSLQITVSGSAASPLPVLTASIEFTNDDPKLCGGAPQMFTDAAVFPSMIMSSSVATLTALSSSIQRSLVDNPYRFGRLKVTSQVTTSAATFTGKLFGRE